MKNYFSLLFFTFLIINPALFAQEHWCGMNRDDLRQVKQRLIKNRAEMKGFVHDRSAVEYIPVRFFQVGDISGNGHVSEKLCFTALCNLNEAFLDHDFQFYLKEFKKINQNTIYSNPMSNSGYNALNSQMIGKYDALNIFVVDEIPDPSSVGEVLAYYQPPAGLGGDDWVVCTKNNLADLRVLTHEIGHFFSLLHPFDGWEVQPYDEAIHGNPVTQFWAPDGFSIVELVDGTNCPNAGDMICDTPADYMFGPSQVCSYNLNVRDKNNELLTPQLENYMNYFDNCSDYFFTDNQSHAMREDIFSFDRNYLRQLYTPNTTPVSPPQLIFPEFDQDLTYHKNVYLEWEKVAGAENYFLELTTGTSTIRLITDTNFFLFDELDDNRTYLWKVMPFNDGYTCSPFSSLGKFRTGEGVNSVNQIEGVDDWRVYPNPIEQGGMITISLEVSETVDATISIANMAGIVVEDTVLHTFGIGSSSLNISTNHLPTGIYLLSLRSTNGILNKKIIIQ